MRKTRAKKRTLTDTYKARGRTTKGKTLTAARVSGRRKLQTGARTSAADRQTKARYPGRRVSAAGSEYTEKRRNRSDASKVRKR